MDKAHACTPKCLLGAGRGYGTQAWYLHVLRRNPPKHTLLRTRLRRVILFAFIHGHLGLLRRRINYPFGRSYENQIEPFKVI